MPKPEQRAPVTEALADVTVDSEYDSPVHHYAWGRMGRLLIQEEFKEVLSATPVDETFVYLDGCSSTPWLREVMRSQFARHEYLRQTNSMIMDFTDKFRKRDESLPWQLVKMRQEKMNELRSILSSKALPRQILQASIFEILSDPKKAGVYTRQEDRLKAYFLERFTSFPSRFLAEIYENEQRGDTAGWRSLVVEEAPVSFADILGSLEDIHGPKTSLTVEEIKVFIDSMAENFAKQLSGTLRPTAKFFSIDIEGIDIFRHFAYRNFPLNTLTTRFFRNVLDPDRHIVGNIADLNMFDDKRVSVYSMIEGYPFYIDLFGDEESSSVLAEAARVIKPGGRLIMFPWIARDGRDLSQLEEQLDNLGFNVRIEEKDKKTLLDNMGPRELRLVERSPIFQDTSESNVLPLLVAKRRAA